MTKKMNKSGKQSRKNRTMKKGGGWLDFGWLTGKPAPASTNTQVPALIPAPASVPAPAPAPYTNEPNYVTVPKNGGKRKTQKQKRSKK